MTLAADRRPRVLCVDDDAFLLDICTRTIGVDYEVLTASSGAQALQLIENSEPIQVVISDPRRPQDLCGIDRPAPNNCGAQRLPCACSVILSRT
jgi:DNA-binding NtrC family response regulator